MLDTQASGRTTSKLNIYWFDAGTIAGASVSTITRREKLSGVCIILTTHYNIDHSFSLRLAIVAAGLMSGSSIPALISAMPRFVDHRHGGTVFADFR